MPSIKSAGAAAALITLIATQAAPATAQTPTDSPATADSRSSHRYGSLPLEAVVRTDERYGRDGLFQGPRGWNYWTRLEHPKPIQNPNLWPDSNSTYFISRFAMPAGSRLNVHFKYPHARYFQFALYKWERNTFVSTGEAIAGPRTEPDSGSTNPFRLGADRLAQNRDFTLRVVAADAPQDSAGRAANTLYAGKEGGELQCVVRIYLPDQGWDGAGWGPGTSPSAAAAFRYDGTLADGTRLSAAEVVRQFARPMEGATKPPLTVDQWVALVRANDNDPSLDPATAPALKEPKWQKFWTIEYSLVGAFKTPEAQAKIPYAGAMEGGGDPSTQYFATYLSRKFGPVYLMRGKMPTFPNTYAGEDGKGLAVTPDAQTQYWSIVSCEAAPSGQIVDGLTDFQVPLDAERNYTIVVSRPEDRPANATLENGVAWLEWSPRGEGLDDPKNRADFGMLMLRIMATNPDWKERPDNVTQPGMEEAVMGPYFPKGYYTTKQEFEATQGATRTGQVTMTSGQGQSMPLTMQSLPDSRGYMYCELVFNYGDKGNDIYSTSPLAQAKLDWWNSLDVEALAQKFGAQSVYKNGPQWWSMDEVGVMASKPVPVAGTDMVFGAHLPAGTLTVPKYTVFNPAKFQNLLWKAGKPVYELVDPDGHVYVLQGHKVPTDSLATLGERFKQLPEGWQYRVQVLTRDLVMKLTPAAPIPSVQDEFDQIYIRIPQ